MDDQKTDGALELEQAEQRCVERGVHLTELRKAVFAFLLAADRPVKAYDLLERFREKGKRLTPATIYRVLDFLIDAGLIHKIACINAYMPCTCEHKDSSHVFFVCEECQQVKEIEDQLLLDSMRARFSELGIELTNTAIEMRGMCSSCTTKKA